MHMPQPTPEHQWLASHAGEWIVDGEMAGPPGQPSFPVHGRDTVRTVGPFWISARFEADLFGHPYAGLATMTFDPARGKFISRWIDAMGPGYTDFEGERGPDGVLRQQSTSPTPFGPGASFLSEETEDGPDRRTFTMRVRLPDGTQHQLLHYKYRRA